MVFRETVHGKLEIIWNTLEEETEDTVGESGWLLAVWNNTVNDMHLEIEKLTINGVLRWCMEMILESLQLGALAVLVKQTNGVRDEVVVVGCLVLQNKLVLAAFFVVLQLL